MSVEQAIEAVEKYRGEDREQWLRRHGDWGKWMVLQIARRHSSQTLTEFGSAMDYSAVSEGLRRFEKTLAKHRVLSQAHTKIVDILNLET